MGRYRYQGFLFAPKGRVRDGSGTKKKKPGRPSKIISVEVELLHQTEKALKVRDKKGRTVWVPKAWTIDVLNTDSVKRCLIITQAHWKRAKPVQET